jgi:glycosyltransferase involved in cell wall biosynthesis
MLRTWVQDSYDSEWHRDKALRSHNVESSGRPFASSSDQSRAMSNDSTRPLVTFYVMSYNQSAFVREAVEAALAQTYTPTEILLSDDCSTDDTFEIIQETVKGYSGPHKIVLNRNARNLGVSDHVNRIVELASGELIIAADGDDVSHPQRTELLVEAWLSNGKPAALVSSLCCIDAVGNVSRTRVASEWMAQFLPAENESRAASLRRFSVEGSPRLISCSGAWTKGMYEAFGPMSSGIWYEDDLITLRAWMFDRIVFIPEALVSYREHDSNIFNRVPRPLNTVDARQFAEEATIIQSRRRREALLGYIPDLDRALHQQWITSPLCDEVKRNVATRCAFHRVMEDWWSVSWATRVAGLLVLIRHGGPSDWRWGSSRLLPFPIFLSIGALWGRIRSRLTESVIP